MSKKEEEELGEWVHEQRLAYKNGILSQDQIKKLQSIPGWVWVEEMSFIDRKRLKDLLNDKEVDDYFFNELKEFKEKFGHCDVPKDYKSAPDISKLSKPLQSKLKETFILLAKDAAYEELKKNK